MDLVLDFPPLITMALNAGLADGLEATLLCKPFRKQELVEAIAAALEK